MKLKEFDILLDIKKYRKNEEIEIVQGDFETNIFNITLYDELNVYPLNGLNIEIAFAKPDGTTVLQSMEDEENPIILAGNKIVCTLKTNTIAAPGKVLAEVRILDGDRLLTSTRFEFFVRRSIVNDKTIESTNEFPILNKKIKEVDDLIEEIKGMETIKGDDGKSAYEVWLEAGNTGTVEDYLTSLRGETPSIEHLENAVDNKLAEVDDVISLGTSINVSLKKTIDTANDKLLKLDSTVVNANTVKEKLNTSIAVGENINSSLESNMAQGNNINQILDDKVVIAINKKGELEDSINTANTTKSQLDNSISKGDIIKGELNDIIAGTDFEQVINDIADLKQDKHNHTNKDVLDKLSDDNGALKFDGQDIGIGDMEKSIYDKNNNGVVDISEDSTKLGGYEPSYYAKQTELNNKVDKVEGKQLSTEDYTTEEKNKLKNIEENADKTTKENITNALGYTPIKSVNDSLPDENGNVKVEIGSDIEIVNNLNETVDGKALDATQGKILNDKKMDKSGGIFTGEVNHGGNLVIEPLLNQYTEKYIKQINISGNVSIDFPSAQCFVYTLAGDVVFDYNKFQLKYYRTYSYTIYIYQLNGQYSITFPSTTKWRNNIIPDLQENGKHMILLTYIDGSWDAMYGGVF